MINLSKVKQLLVVAVTFSFILFNGSSFAQINDYIFEEETFGLESNEFGRVSNMSNGKIYFTKENRKKLWVYDMESNETTFLLATDDRIIAYSFIEFKGYTYFNMVCTSGKAIFRTKNTPSTTTKILQIADNANEGFVTEYFVHNGYLYISDLLTNRIYRLNDPESELELFVDMKEFGEQNDSWSLRRDFFALDSYIFFSGGLDGEEVLWSTSGDLSNLQLLRNTDGEVIQNVDISLFFNDTFYFNMDDDKKETWMYDRSNREASFFHNFDLGVFRTDYINYNDKLIIELNDPDHGNEPWIFDGTQSGTFLLKDIDQDGNSNPDNFSVHNGKVNFVSYNEDALSTERWETDGTILGTKLVGYVDRSVEHINFGDRQFELIKRGSNDLLLSEYIGDGESIDVKLIEDATLDYNLKISNIFDDFFVFGTFIPGTDTYNYWASDGTESNTVLITDQTDIGILRKRFDFDDSVIFSGQTSDFKALLYRIKKESSSQDLPTVIDSSSLIDYDVCTDGNVNSITEEVQVDDPILIYPNPTDKIITIQSTIAKKFDIEIINALGEVVFARSEQRQEYVVNINGFVAGTYIVLAKYKDGKVSKKQFVKQ